LFRSGSCRIVVFNKFDQFWMLTSQSYKNDIKQARENGLKGNFKPLKRFIFALCIV